MSGEGERAAGADFRGLTLAELRGAAEARPRWLWRGYLAAGDVTLLTSQWKAGKTTLLSVLLDRMGRGGELAGLGVAPGRAAVVSEEAAEKWLRRGERLDLGGHVTWFCRPFAGRPRPGQWLALLDHLAGLHERAGLDLVVIDSLATFLPGDENRAAGVLEALLPLQRLTGLGLSVLVMHHPRKGRSPLGQAARGSGALAAYVDVLVEKDWYARGDEDDRRRRLRAWSRHEETPRRLVIELNAAGTAYAGLGDFAQEAFGRGWEVLRRVLGQAAGKRTRAEILDEWPQGEAPPDPATVWQWLERAVGEGLLLRDGPGLRGRPYRYWLPGQEEKWRASPFYAEESPYVRELLEGNAEAEAFLRRMGLVPDEDEEPRRGRRRH